MMILAWCLLMCILPVLGEQACLEDTPKETFPSHDHTHAWHKIPVQLASGLITPILENEYHLDAYAIQYDENHELHFIVYLDTESHKLYNAQKELCLCIKDTKKVYPGHGKCKEHARICFKFSRCYGAGDDKRNKPHCNGHIIKVSSEAVHGDNDPNPFICYQKYDVRINMQSKKATIDNNKDNVYDINEIMPISGQTVPVFEIGLVAFFKDDRHVERALTDEDTSCLPRTYDAVKCKHHDFVFVRKSLGGGPLPPRLPGSPTESPDLPPALQSNPPTVASSPQESTTDDDAAAAGVTNLVLYIVIGVIIAAFIILLIIVILRCIQGKWLCGIACFKKEQSEDENPRKTYKFTGNSDMNKVGGGGSNDKQAAAAPENEKPNEINVEEGKNGENDGGQKSADKPIVNDQKPAETAAAATPDAAAPLATPDAPLKKPSAEGKKEEKEKKGEKTSKSSSSSAAETKTKGTVSKDPKPDQAPNMLLLETKEDETQKVARSPSKRKANIEKNYKEPAQTKNITQDPGAVATKGGKATAAAATMKKKTEARTGIPKSETDLNTDKPEKSGLTKGVSATQPDRGTENVAPTQRATTMATGAGKTTKGVSATQVDHVTVATTQRTMATGAAKTTKGVSATQGDNVTENVGPTQRTATMVTGAKRTTKGVSATQGDQYTENVGTTQHATTMATGAGRTSKGVSATQGDHYTENVGTTQRTGTMATGAGRTSKGVSATQGDHYTENVGTTQHATTMATGAGRTSKGVSATQGDHYTENVGTTQRTGTMATGAAKTTKGVSATQGDKA